MSEITLATPANMRKFEDAHPGRTVNTPDGEVFIEGRRALALSLSTGEQYSASSADYWDRDPNEPLRDRDGFAMLLVTSHTIYKDALTGRLL